MCRKALPEDTILALRARIMIIGRPGNGKSTFGRKLADALNRPLIHLDRHYYKAGWEACEKSEFDALHAAFIAQDTWIIEGNILPYLAPRYERATLLILFQYPLLVSYWRLIKRFFMKDTTIYDRAPGCPETLCWKILSFAWRFDALIAEQLPELQKRFPNTEVVVIRSDADAQALFEHLTSRGA